MFMDVYGTYNEVHGGFVMVYTNITGAAYPVGKA